MSYSVNFQFFPVDSELEAYLLAGDITRHLAAGLPAEQWIEQHIAALLPYTKHVRLQEFINQEQGAAELLYKLCDSWVRNIFQIRFLYWPEHQLLGAVSDTFPGSMPNHILTASTGVVFQDSTDQAYPYQYWGMYVPLFRQLRAGVKALTDNEVARGTEFSDPDYARRSLLYQKISAALDISPSGRTSSSALRSPLCKWLRWNPSIWVDYISELFLMLKIEKLRKAGFSLETFEDGKFWVYESGPGGESGKVLMVCRRCIDGFEETSVQDTFVLQCDFNFKNPVLYIDGFMWQLSPRDFADVVRGLGRSRIQRNNA